MPIHFPIPRSGGNAEEGSSRKSFTIAYCMPGIVLGVEDTSANKTGKLFCLSLPSFLKNNKRCSRRCTWPDQEKIVLCGQEAREVRGEGSVARGR